MNTSKSPRQPSLNELMTRYLTKPRLSPDAHEVELHENLGAFRTSSSAAWEDALAAARCFGLKFDSPAAPPEWVSYATKESTKAVVMALGLFPQSVGRIPMLSNLNKLSEISRAHVSGFPTLKRWLNSSSESQSVILTLASSGIAADIGECDAAMTILQRVESQCEGVLRTVWVNQKAAILMMSGKNIEASNLWGSIENDLSGVVLFNLAVASLGQDEAEAKRLFDAAGERLVTAGGWGHLARLYSSLLSR